MIDYSNIISRIGKNMIIRSIPIIIACVLLLVLAIYAIKNKLATKKLLFFIIVMIIIGICYVVMEFVIFKIEIQNKLFIRYEGTFTYTTVLSEDGNQIDLLEENKTKRLHCLYFGYDDGTYDGYVVYTKLTKWVVEVG